MTEYIEREALLNKLHEIGGCGAEPDTWADGYDKGIDAAYGLAQRMPAANAVPVRHGEWKHNDYYESWADKYICSECNHHALSDGDYRHELSKYCPGCGAQMNLGGSDDD